MGVKLILNYSLNDGTGHEEEEVSYYTGDAESSGWAAYEFGFYFDSELGPMVMNDNVWDFSMGHWDPYSVGENLQKFFEHRFDQTKYTYKIGFFET